LSRIADLNLAVIGNCQIAALIDATGSIIWACLPRLDGDPVFNALLNGDAPGGRLWPRNTARNVQQPFHALRRR
jgi:hypothetical protein